MAGFGLVMFFVNLNLNTRLRPTQPRARPREPELEEEPAGFEMDLEHDVRPSPDYWNPDQPPAQSHRPEPTSICPDGMVVVEGLHCQTVVHQCVEYVSQRRDRCRKYVPQSRCLGKRTPKHFCIDAFEYPNREGEKPLVGVDYFGANDLCGHQGKRLCTSSEWELACEGNGLLPYPYGYVRDSSACNFDKPYIIPNDDAYANPKTREAEITRLDQREPAGNRSECVSSFGVRDMTGNVDEWVENESGLVDKAPFRSGLKGGYWGPVRNRCRPMTVDHNQWHTGYQIGFRCCSDLPTVGVALPVAPERQ